MSSVHRVDAVIKKFLLLILAVCGAVSAQETADPADTFWRQAVLYRDEWGVPHIYADNTRAMAFAFGYAQAEDHLEAMLLAYRMANGRASEVLGEALAASDELAIRLAHAELAYEAYQRADSVTLDLCEGFAQGVNVWLLEHPNDAPAWAEGVHPADILALLHRYLLSMAPFDYPESTHLLPGTPSANAWAVAPSMSKNGDAMLVMNPHTRYEGPYQWYEAHLATKELNVYGGTLFGLPVILMGHNETLGWALSPNQADIADVYIEYPPKAPARNPKSFMPGRNAVHYQGVHYIVNTYKSYYVRGENGFDRRVVPQQRTVHGPVIATAAGRPLTWRVGGYTDFGGIRQLFDMGLASDLNQFRGVVDRQQLSSFHVLYADSAGNIWYQYNARVGQKPKAVGAPGSPMAFVESVYDFPLSTLEGLFEWGNLLAPDALPWALNPKSGYLQACGTPPWLVTANSGSSAANWPTWLVRDSDSYRAKRVRRLFSMGPRSFRDLQAMLFDTVVPLAAEAAPFLLWAAESNPDWLSRAHPDLLVGLDMFGDWNYLASTDSMAMTFFHVWWSVLRLDADGNVMRDEALHARIQENAPWFQIYALESAAEAAKLLRNEFQTMNVPWGEVHTIRRGRREEPLPGAHSGGPIFASADQTYVRGKWPVDGGYGFAMAVRFSEVPQAVTLVPFGTSEDPTSPHYSDQLDLLVQRRLKVASFKREEVERRAASAYGKAILLRARGDEAAVSIEAAAAVKARLAVSDQLNASLPPATVAFTPFVEPVVTPASVPVTIVVQLAVPAEICALENLGKLAVFGYHPVVGWIYVPEQALDYDRRTFAARAYESQVFAVLGAESFRLQDAPPGRLARSQEDSSPRAPGAPEDRSSGQREVTDVARNEDAAVVDLSQEDRMRVAGLLPRAPWVPDRALSNFVPQRKPGGLRVITPAVPPGWVPQRDWPVGAPPPRAVSPGNAAPRPLVSSPRTFAPAISPGADVVPARPSDSPVFEEPEPLKIGPESAAETQPVAVPEDNSPEPPSTRVAISPEGPEPSPSRRNVVWSDQSPSALLKPIGTGRELFFLAPDPSQASPMLIGKDLELRPPHKGALFRIHAERNVRAQAILREIPPEAFPPGLTAFSPVFEILCSPATVIGTTAITIGLESGVYAPGRFADIKLYAYDRKDGWTPMYRQKSNPDTRSFSALDPAFRIYAVLGPREAALNP